MALSLDCNSEFWNRPTRQLQLLIKNNDMPHDVWYYVESSGTLGMFGFHHHHHYKAQKRSVSHSQLEKAVLGCIHFGPSQ